MIAIGKAAILAAFAFGAAKEDSPHWPQFRGPNGDGKAAASGPVEWGAGKNIAWKIEIPGFAWSSPVVWGDKVFVTTAISEKQKKPAEAPASEPPLKNDAPAAEEKAKTAPPDGEKDDKPASDEKRRERKKGGGGGGMFGSRKPPEEIHRFEVYCLDRSTGKILWKQLAAEQKPTIPTHPTNTYASETPVVDGERVYAYFAMVGLFCYDLDGKLLWKKDLGSYPMAAGFGTGSSPSIADGRLFIQCDNEKNSFLVALDAKTGSELWRVDRGVKSSWSTPFVWRTKDRTEVVACGSGKVSAYDPATGKMLWEIGGVAASFSASPVADAEMIYFGNSGPTSIGPLYGVKAGASGDVSLKKDETSSAAIAWYRVRSGPGLSSPVLFGGRLYVPGRGLLACYDAKTGEQIYKERLPGAKQFTASAWIAGGKIFLLDEDGQTFVVEPGPKLKLLGSNKLEGEMYWSTPALSSGVLVIRGTDHLYGVRQ